MTNSHDVLHKIVTQKEKDRTITNAVEVIQTVATDLKSQVTQLEKDRTVTNAIAANLKSQVTQAEKDRTVTGDVTVTPSGDMARKAPYDRNPLYKNQYYGIATLPSHGSTTRWQYTVPNNRLYYNSLFQMTVKEAIATAGKQGNITFQSSEDDGANWKNIGGLCHYATDAPRTLLTITAIFYMTEGIQFRVQTKHDDTVNHGFYLTANGLEFDI